MSEGLYTTMSIRHEDSHTLRAMSGSFGIEFDGSTNLDTPHTSDEDFLLGDISEFSNGDIAAPIQTGNYSSPQSDETNSASTMNTTHTNSSASATYFLKDFTALGSKAYDSALHSHHEVENSSLCQPGEDETGFEWLTSLEDESLLLGASNFGSMESFLMNDSEPFHDYTGMQMKDTGDEDEDAIKAKDMTSMGQISMNATHNYNQDVSDDRVWDDGVNGLKDCGGLTVFVPHATGSRSRTKRARSSGWSSTSRILCNNRSESTSPTDSLTSTSQLIILPTPHYGNNPSFICDQEKGYLHHSTGFNIDSSTRLTSDGSSNTPVCDIMSKGSKVVLTEQWPKHDFDNPREESVGDYGGNGLQPRRCTHCQSQKTPQWRAGPQGPKTLCNACGVRYKSGRLFDEYRPAKSPTFLSYKHSNSHKKVMEMRRRKTFQYAQQQQHAVHHVRTPTPKLAHATDQQLISKLKIKLNHCANSEPLTTAFSDVTLISNKNAIDSPSSLFY